MSDTTEHYQIPLPAPENTLANDVQRLIEALQKIDLLIHQASQARDMLRGQIQNLQQEISAEAQARSQAIADAVAESGLLPITRTAVNGVAKTGKHTVITAAATIKAPARPSAGQRFGFTNASGGDEVYIDWGSKTVKGIAPNPPVMRVPAGGSAEMTYDGQTWIEQ